MGLKCALKIFCSSKFISLSSHLFDIFRTESRGPWHTFVLEDGTFVHLSGLHIHTHGISLQGQRNEVVLQYVVSVLFHRGSALCHVKLSPDALETMLCRVRTG